jgi:hypothetical protein
MHPRRHKGVATSSTIASVTYTPHFLCVYVYLHRLRQKEEKIEAWEKHTKEKANAQLKKLEVRSVASVSV